MTIDDQLREIARRADRLQQVITAEEIVQRASSQGTRPFAANSRFNDDHSVVSYMPVPSTEEEATMIDLEIPQTDQRRRGTKQVVIAALLAAAAVVAIALVAIRKDDPVSPANQPSTTVTVPPTTPPQALASAVPPPGDEQFAAGTYFVDEVGGSPTPRITVTLGDGWRSFKLGNSVGVYTDGTSAFSFIRPTAVFKDACHYQDGFVQGPLTTLDDVVAALSEQGGWVEVIPPSDVSVSGYLGKTFQRTAPADFRGCDDSGSQGDPTLPSWADSDGNRFDYLAGELETLYFLDVNGTVIGFDTILLPGDSDGHAAAELAALVDSIRIEPT